MEKGQGKIEIKIVTSEKDLGMIVNQALNLSEHIAKKINTAHRNLGVVFRTFTLINKEIFLNLYKTIVRLHLEYAVTV